MNEKLVIEDCFMITGDAKEFGITQYNGFVATKGIVLKTPTDDDDMVLVELDCLGDEYDVIVSILKEKITIIDKKENVVYIY